MQKKCVTMSVVTEAEFVSGTACVQVCVLLERMNQLVLKVEKKPMVIDNNMDNKGAVDLITTLGLECQVRLE
jgi:hypothetical protein